MHAAARSPHSRQPQNGAGRVASWIAVLSVAAIAASACTPSRHPRLAAQPTSATSSAPTPSSIAAGSASSSPTSSEPTATPGAAAVITATLDSARLPVALSRLAAAEIGGHVLIAGGLDVHQHTTAQTLNFDPSIGSMTIASALPVAVHDAAAGVLNGAAVIAGGGSAASSAAVQSVRADGTAATIGALPQPRSDDSVAVDGPTLYVSGGYDGVHELPDVLATTDGSSFRRVGSLAETVRYGGSYAAAGSVWVFGGEHAGHAVADIQRVDTATGTGSVIGKLPHPLAHAAVVVLHGAVLIIGGTDGHNPQDTIFAFQPATGAITLAGSLPESVSDTAAVVVGDTAYVLGGEALTAEQTVTQTAAVVAVRFSPVSATANRTAAAAAPFSGGLLIADRGNNRLLMVDTAGTIGWTFPNATAPPPPSGFYFPDDAFFINHGTGIISNQEGNHTIVEIAYPSGTPLWSYGTPGQAGSAPGFLHEPDDAYKLANGQVVVADANNCRILFLSAQAKPIAQIGTTNSCVHKPPTSLGYPNGDTPLQNGNILISEVTGSWISEYTPAGALAWTVHLPVSYPSDPQQIGPDTYIVADYARPGGITKFDRSGHILWDYHIPAGHGMLDHPSLAEVLPSGLICVNDDYRHRVVLIDPATKTIVWQYGVDDVSGTAPGLLNTPDGFDLLAPDGTTPTHPWTG